MSKKENLIKIAFAAHPHGIKGEVELRLINPDTNDSILDDEMKVWIFPFNEKSKVQKDGEEWEIKKVRFGNKIICELEGVKDRTHLESLLPFELFVARESFPEPDEDEVYLVDLIDMQVVDSEGNELGKLESFSDNGHQYLFNVRLNEGGGVLMTLPYVDAFFPKIDMIKKQITMVLPEYTE
jgi:16S rRNA processing protein RimM